MPSGPGALGAALHCPNPSEEVNVATKGLAAWALQHIVSSKGLLPDVLLGSLLSLNLYNVFLLEKVLLQHLSFHPLF